MNAPSRTSEFDVDPVAIVTANLRRDALAEALEAVVFEATNVLAACRQGNDECVVEWFRLCDIAFRSARLTAAEIRDSIAGDAA